MDKKEYQEYLNSEEWQITRAAALKYGDSKCALCARTDNLQVHHNCYDRIGAELPSDLVVLCDEHHWLYHDYADGNTEASQSLDRELLETHIKSIINSAAEIDKMGDPHYKGVARDAIINDLAGFLAETIQRRQYRAVLESKSN